MITHLKRADLEDHLHLFHLFPYISAYEYCHEHLQELSDDIADALLEAARTLETVIVDQDGECCLHVHPSGAIDLMLPWRRYTVVEED